MRNLSIEGELPSTIVAALGRHPGLGDLDDERRLEVAGTAVVLQFEPGETIVRQGEATDAFFVLLQGEVAVHVDHREVGRVAPPFTIGEVGCLLEKPRTATVTAVERVVVLRWTALALRQMFREIPDFGYAVARFLADRLDHVAGSCAVPGEGEEAVAGMPGIAAR